MTVEQAIKVLDNLNIEVKNDDYQDAGQLVDDAIKVAVNIMKQYIKEGKNGEIC